MKQLAVAAPRPSLGMLGVEPFRAAMASAWHNFDAPVTTKPGDGHPVVIFPGLGADGMSVATLRTHCCSCGCDAFVRGQGLNTGPQGQLDDWLNSLKTKLVDRLAGNTQGATLIGWSLGGLYAREIGKLMAPHVRQMITIATPFNAGADPKHVDWLFRMLSGGWPLIDPGAEPAPAHADTDAHHLHLQPFGRCGGVADLSARQALASRSGD